MSLIPGPYFIFINEVTFLYGLINNNVSIITHIYVDIFKQYYAFLFWSEYLSIYKKMFPRWLVVTV